MPPIILGPLCLLATVMLSTALGYRILRWSRFGTDSPLTLGILSLGLGLGSLQFIPFLLLTAGVGTPPVIQVSVIIIALLLLPDMVTIIRGAWGIRRPWKLYWWEWLSLGILGSLLALIFLRTVMPAIDADVLSYHLTAPLRFFSEGRFFHILTITPSNWPMAVEFLYGILLTFDSEAPVAVVPFLLGMTTIALVYLHAARIGTRMSAAIAIVLLLAQWTFWWEMSTGMIDLGTACFALLSLFLLDPKVGNENRMPAIILAAVFAGFAATTKLQGIWVIASLMIVLFLREKGSGTKSALKISLTFGFIAFLIVAPWYLKTWIVTGNPFYPLFYDVFGGNELSASGSSRYVNLYRLIDASHGLPSFMPLTATNISLYHSVRIGLAIACTFILIRISRCYPNSMLLAFAGVFTAFICAASSFHMRFLLPAYAASVVGISYTTRRLNPAFAVLPCVCAAILAVWISQTRLHPDLPLTWKVATGTVGRDEYFRIRALHDYEVIRFANNHLPDGSRILLGTFNENTAMLRHQSYWANYWLQDSFHYESLDHLLLDIRRIGVTHLILGRTFPPWYEDHCAWGKRVDLEHAILMELASRFGMELFSDRDISLYELRLPVNE